MCAEGPTLTNNGSNGVDGGEAALQQDCPAVAGMVCMAANKSKKVSKYLVSMISPIRNERCMSD